MISYKRYMQDNTKGCGTPGRETVCDTLPTYRRPKLGFAMALCSRGDNSPSFSSLIMSKNTVLKPHKDSNTKCIYGEKLTKPQMMSNDKRMTRHRLPLLAEFCALVGAFSKHACSLLTPTLRRNSHRHPRVAAE